MHTYQICSPLFEKWGGPLSLSPFSPKKVGKPDPPAPLSDHILTCCGDCNLAFTLFFPLQTGSTFSSPVWGKRARSERTFLIEKKVDTLSAVKIWVLKDFIIYWDFHCKNISSFTSELETFQISNLFLRTLQQNVILVMNFFITGLEGYLWPTTYLGHSVVSYNWKKGTYCMYANEGRS